MKQRPITIWLTSIVYMLIAPVGYGYLLMDASWDVQQVLATTSWEVLMIIGLGSAVGYGIFTVRPWGYFSFLGYSVAVVLGLTFRHLVNPSGFNYAIVVAVVGGIGAIAYTIQRHFSAPYFNPQMRWWETDPRFKADLNVELDIDGEKQIANTQDISESGCFVKCEKRLVPGDLVYLKIELLDYHFEVPCRVIRVSSALDGYGLMFLDMDRSKRKQIKSVIRYMSEFQYQKSATQAAA